MNRGDPPPRPLVCGVRIDSLTRCAHYGSPRDIVAIRMKCCGIFYACKDCHEALAGHAIERWTRDELDLIAVLCGACGSEMSITRYLECASACPTCHAPFNAACRDHYHCYFEGFSSRPDRCARN